MRYKAHMINVDGLGKPSVLPLQSKEQTAAIAEFRRLQLAHGDQTILKLKLVEIDDSNKEKEVVVT